MNGPTPDHPRTRITGGGTLGTLGMSGFSSAAGLLHQLKTTIGLGKIARSASFATGLSSFMARRRPWMRIIVYHGVGPNEADSFDQQMEYLAERFSIVPLETIVKKLSDPRAKPSRELAITFDDGLRNQYSVVYPILKRRNLPATFFVCPGLIDSGRWIWNHEARARVRSLSVDRRTELSRALKAPGFETEQIIEWMKGLRIEARKRAEDTVRAATSDFAPTAEGHSNSDIMSWEELSAIDPGLVTIGSHTSNHPILTSLDDPELQSELRDSRAQLEEHLGRPVEHFCYPNGTYDDRVARCVQEHYQAAVTMRAGKVVAGCNAHALPRTPSANDLSLLAWRMLRPAA